MNNHSLNENIHFLLLDLYSYLKLDKIKRVRKQEFIINIIIKTFFKQLYQKKEKTQDLSTDEISNNIDDILLINYIKNSFDVIVSYLIEERINIYNEEKDNTRQEYESVLIKYEADIREHIKIEHQMKLYIDSLEIEKEELKYKYKLKKIKIEQLTQKLNNIKITDEDQSLIIIRREESSINSSQDTRTENDSTAQMGKFRKFEEEISDLKKKLQKYEEQNKNLSNNIKKLKEQYNNKNNEIQELENKYKKENKILKKQIQIAENKIKELIDINNNTKNIQTKKITKTNKNNISFQINHVESNNSMHKITSNEKDDLSFLLNKTTSIRKSQASSLSATSSVDKIEKYLKRKFSTLKSQKTQRTSSAIKLKKKDKNNSVLNKKRTEDLMRLFLNDSLHQNHNLTDRIRTNRIIQKSDENSAYYNQYCNNKNKIKNINNTNMMKKTKANLTKKPNIKNNIFEMINNINNINIFANNLKQNNHNMCCNDNSSFNNIFRNDIVKQCNNSSYNLNNKKKSK